MSYIDADTAELIRLHGSRRALAFRLASASPLRYWTGIGEIEAPMRSVAIDGEIYLGGGRWSSLPQLRQLINGVADRASFTLSGLDEGAVAQIAATAAPIDGVALHVGFVLFDGGWQPVTPIIPYARLTADYVAAKYEAGDPPSAQIILSCHYGDAAQARPTLTYYTPAHQRLRDPTDMSCSHVFTYQAGHTVAWPRF